MYPPQNAGIFLAIATELRKSTKEKTTEGVASTVVEILIGWRLS